MDKKTVDTGKWVPLKFEHTLAKVFSELYPAETSWTSYQKEHGDTDPKVVATKSVLGDRKKAFHETDQLDKATHAREYADWLVEEKKRKELKKDSEVKQEEEKPKKKVKEIKAPFTNEDTITAPETEQGKTKKRFGDRMKEYSNAGLLTDSEQKIVTFLESTEALVKKINDKEDAFDKIRKEHEAFMELHVQFLSDLRRQGRELLSTCDKRLKTCLEGGGSILASQMKVA